jgi:Phage integrase, N-terminal SAM-like domain
MGSSTTRVFEDQQLVVIDELTWLERHLRALNRSDSTIESYLEGARQAERFLTTRRRTLTDARRADLEAFLAGLLARRSASTAATRHKVLCILYRDRILIRVLHHGLFPQDRTCHLGERRTARDRCEPLGSHGVWTKRGPSWAPWGSGSRPVADASGAPVLRGQGPIGRPGTARPILKLA